MIPDGKFLSLEAVPFRLRGVTYGTFAPRASDGEPYPKPPRVEEDFASIAAAGLNTVRVYTLPPEDVLDGAAEAGLRLIVGLHYADWRQQEGTGRRARRAVLDAGRRAVDAALERCAGRPEVAALSVGNEVPADLVRLHGIGSVEEVLSALVAEVHAGAPDLLATYTNYPSTEYLHVEGQDFVSFNVFLESPDALRAYLRHLQVVAGDLPLVVTELGLASDLHGLDGQAESLDWQLRIAEETACAGAMVFSWTDEWAVGGHSVESWGFGVTDSERRPKPALDVVRDWTCTDVRSLRDEWPKVSVVVCARNEETLVGRCLESLRLCDYPDLDVVFCDDGSTDRTLEIARRFPFRVLALEHGGLSRARNAGLRAALGEIVAYVDADAECHPEWPYHLALSLEEDGVVATGGPNLPPPQAPFVERAVAESPGGPVHVLVGDDRAEHVPGCNMAFRKDAIEEAGAFDPVFTAAGDDVHVCWNLLDGGHEIGFAPAAQVRHHRPATIRDYFRQQRSYGRAERLLQGRHPHRFNNLGQPRWAGSIYGGPRVLPNLLRPVVYHGPMGFAPFQPVARRRSEVMRDRLAAALPALSLVFLLGALAPLSLWWLMGPAIAAGLILAYGLSVAVALRPPWNEPRPLALRLVVAGLHIAQPFVRTWGRLRGSRAGDVAGPSREWTGERGDWLRELMRDLGTRQCTIRPGDIHDDYDLAVTIGPLVACRVRTAVAWEWLPRHGVRLRPRAAAVVVALVAVALAPVSLWASAATLGSLLVLTAVEGLLLRRVVKASLQETTMPALSPPARSEAS
jgi:GT2 family glycosyltransferase/exo-beta-1,3-glucanase (GH17 family)